MNPEQKCPRCGQPQPPDAPVGRCPKCLIELALEAASAETSMPTMVGASQLAPIQPSPAANVRVKYFGDYELVEEIARGGMGVVWKARQVSLNRPVALKMILAGKFASDSDVRRFHTEAEAAANLQHPNIVAIHEVGEHEGQHYFSMDYVEGKNLAELVRDGPLSATKAATLVKTIAEAIHYAHQRGTLHRDLKPSNVLMDASGQPRITDFGLAKRFGVPPLGGSGGRIPAEAGTPSELTQTGAVMGSPSYMSPEQAAGKNDQVGPSSDVYSIGAMLYHLLTGRTPFVAETPMATLRKVMEEEPAAPSKLNPQTPSDLETICLKCLEKRPDRRYHSARELAEELDRFLNHEPILAKPSSAWRKGWSWSQRHPWAIVGMVAIIGIVLLGLAYGLWEQLQHARWEGLPLGPEKEGRDRSKDFASDDYVVILTLVMSLVVFYGRFLKDRQRRNLPISNLQLAVLFASGLLFVGLGLWFEMQLIRHHVWTHDFAWHTLVGIGLGIPLACCWIGGSSVWQAVQTHQSHWSGSATADTEWLPRQSLHYHNGAFVAAMLLNLGVFMALAYLTTPIWQEDFHPDHRSSPEMNIANRMVFVSIALHVSFGGWIYARRKVSKVPRALLIFLGLWFGGGALIWFAMPPVKLIFLAVLTGLLGGFVLVKVVKIRKVEPAEKLPPLALGELFQWDRRAFAITLAVVVIALGLLAVPFFHKHYVIFLPFTVCTALWPAFFMAVRATTGKLREFCLSMLVFVIFFVVFAPILIGLGLPSDPSGMLHMLASILVGLAAGSALIYFGKIRPKAR